MSNARKAWEDVGEGFDRLGAELRHTLEEVEKTVRDPATRAEVAKVFVSVREAMTASLTEAEQQLRHYLKTTAAKTPLAGKVPAPRKAAAKPAPQRATRPARRSAVKKPAAKAPKAS